MILNPWLAMGMVAFLLALMFVALRVYQVRSSPHPELVRKLLHMIMGCVTLTFPWLFDESWPVIVLAGCTIMGLWGLKVRQGLRQQWGEVLHGVSRSSFGDFYFPISVALLFVLAEGNVLLFFIPILILTLADALAALIGIRYGQTQYKTSEGNKSLEGSLAFFTVSFLSVHIPLLLFSDVGRAESLFIAAMIGVLVMLFEAIAWHGLDNLFIPLGTYILLHNYLPMSADILASKLLVLIFLLIGFYLVRRKTTLDGSAILGLVLIAYVSWAVGGDVWLLAPSTVLVAYILFNLSAKNRIGRAHSIQAVVSVGVPGLMILFLAQRLNQPQLLYCYTLSYAVHLALIGVARIKFNQPEISNQRVLFQATLQGWLLLLVPWMVVVSTPHAIYYVLMAILIVFSSAYLFLRWQTGLQDCPIDGVRWWRQGTLATSAALLGSVPLYLLKGI